MDSMNCITIATITVAQSFTMNNYIIDDEYVYWKRSSTQIYCKFETHNKSVKRLQYQIATQQAIYLIRISIKRQDSWLWKCETIVAFGVFNENMV